MKSRYSLDDMRCFCAIAQNGSFKEAAIQLGMPLSTLSRRIRQLEHDLQLRLLNRDAHRVSLTNTGEKYFQRSFILFDELAMIDSDLHREKHKAQGKIRVSSPINAGSHFLRTIFYDFLIQYPDIQLDLLFSNSLIDIEAEGVDVAFRVGNPIMDDWISRPLKAIRFVLCSHLEYNADSINHPSDLSAHSVVLCRPMIPWKLKHNETGERFDFHPQKNVRLEVDEVFMLTQAVMSRLGIGYIPDYFALPAIARGEFQHVLSDWTSTERILSMIYRDRSNHPLRVRLFVEFVMQRFKQNR